MRDIAGEDARVPTIVGEDARVPTIAGEDARVPGENRKL